MKKKLIKKKIAKDKTSHDVFRLLLVQLMKKKTKQNKTNEGTSHHMMFWTPEYSTCYKAPLLNKNKKKKEKEQKKQRKSRRLIWVQA